MSQRPATHDLSTDRRKLRSGRGRTAQSPLEMPWLAWKDILWRTALSLKKDRVGLVAAGVAFYLLLSVVPALTAILALYGMAFDGRDVADQVQSMQGVVPAAILSFLADEMRRLAEVPGSMGFGLALSIVLGLWGASKAHQAIATALDVAYGEKSTRGFFASRLRALALAGTTALTGMLALTLLVIGPTFTEMLGSRDGWLLGIARWPVAALIFWAWLTIVYRFGPTRRAARWRWLSVGSLAAAALWLVISSLLSWYASELANLGRTYGSLAGVALLLIWLFGFGYALLLGAELDAEIEHQTAQDTTVGPARPRGQRGAYVADTLGKAKGEEDPWLKMPDEEQEQAPS